jgi:hypothetical protein
MNQTPTSHLVGATKRFRKRNHGSSTAGSNRGRSARFVTYCPECPNSNMANPEQAEHLTVSAYTKTATCRAGHRWKIQ